MRPHRRVAHALVVGARLCCSCVSRPRARVSLAGGLTGPIVSYEALPEITKAMVNEALQARDKARAMEGKERYGTVYGMVRRRRAAPARNTRPRAHALLALPTSAPTRCTALPTRWTLTRSWARRKGGRERRPSRRSCATSNASRSPSRAGSGTVLAVRTTRHSACSRSSSRQSCTTRT